MSDEETLVPLGDVHLELVHQSRSDERPPSSAIASDYEACVIGAILLSEGEAMHLAVDAGLVDGDFASIDRRFLWRAMRRLHDAGKPVTTLTVTDALAADRRLDSVGGPAGVARYESLMPTTAIVEPYARLVIEDSVRRRLRSACVGATEIVDAHKPIPETVRAIEQEIARASERGTEKAIVGSSDLVDAWTQQLRHRIENFDENRAGLVGTRSGFPGLDKITGGWTKGLTVVGARPAMGKSSFVVQTMLHAAVVEKVPTLFFSLEQPVDEIMSRSISVRSGVPLSVLRGGRPGREHWRDIATASGEISAAPLWIDSTPGITVAEMRRKIKKAKREHGVGLVLVDYLQLVKLGDGGRGAKNERRDLDVGEITSTLLQTTLEVDACTIALSQLSRGLESRVDKRPMLSDLRESGSIEQDAAVVAFLYRDEYYRKDKCPPETKGTCEVIVAKNRNGPTGTSVLRWCPEKVRFENLVDGEF